MQGRLNQIMSVIFPYDRGLLDFVVTRERLERLEREA